MEKIDVSYAALSGQDEAALVAACKALWIEGLPVNLRRWDGGLNDVVVLDPRDSYGKLVWQSAVHGGMAVIGMQGTESGASSQSCFFLESSQDARVVRLMRALESQLCMATSARRAPPVDTEALPAIVRLGKDPTLRKVDLHAVVNGRSLWLLPSRGRVVSVSFSDQLSARDRLFRSDWEFRPVRGHMRPPGEFSTSLDAFYMEGALHRVDRLPIYPYALYSLRSWPDLGTSPHLLDPLRLIRVMRKGPATPSAMAADSGLSIATVSACLWGLQASGLIEVQTQVATQERARSLPPERSLIQRLVRRFGLA